MSKTLVALVAVLSFPAAAASIDARQVRQEARIERGVRSGALNGREAARLEARSAHIAQVEARDRADGRGFTARERAHVQRMESRNSRAIARQAHDRF